MRTRRCLLCVGMLGALVMACPTASALEVGDAAPAIPVTTWVSNTPVSLASAKGKVLVVEFWATWCGPCKVTIPHLNKLHAKYRDQKAVFVGVSREKEAVVRKFMAGLPMSYHVGLSADTAAYMQGIRGIPHAFVVDGAGKIAWHGHPMSGMDRVIKQLVKGTYDPERAKKLATFQKQLRAAKSYEQAYAAVDAAIAAVPDDPGAYRRKRGFLVRQGKHDEARKVLLAMVAACASDGEVAAEAARELATADALERRDLAKALELATKADQLERGQDAGVLSALARVHYEMGHLAKAVEAAQRAAALDSELKPALDFYRNELARRSQDPDAKL